MEDKLFNMVNKRVKEVKIEVLKNLDGLSYGEILRVLNEIELDIKFRAIFSNDIND